MHQSDWSQHIFRNNSLYFFIENNQGLILGFIGIKIILDEAELMNIVVKKDSRNLGIGSFLLKEIIQEASNLKLKNIYLEVNELNIPAINLYKNFKSPSRLTSLTCPLFPATLDSNKLL